jgi:hypothetical protein
MNQMLIDQYVAGRLNDRDAEEFEAYCLSNPEFAKQVEAEQLMKAGIAEVARTSPQDFMPPARDTSWRWRLPLAASFVAALGIVLYSWVPNAVTRAPVLAATSAAGASAGPVLRLAMVRGADGLPALPSGRVRVEIAALFEPDEDYTVMLIPLEGSPAAREVAALERHRPASSVSMQVMVDSDRLAPGAYTLRVRRGDAADEPLDFTFLKR